MHIIVGLGNPGDKYKNTRHNTGRIILEDFWREQKDFSDWKNDTKSKSIISKGLIDNRKVLLLSPDNFMNNSGKSVVYFAKSKLSAKKVVVIYDDLDLPIGTFKIAFNRGSGGHNGVESIRKTLKTKEFVRVRVGISPATPAGKLRKPKGEGKVLDFIMKNFTAKDVETLKKTSKKISEALQSIITEGYETAMNKFN